MILIYWSFLKTSSNYEVLWIEQFSEMETKSSKYQHTSNLLFKLLIHPMSVANSQKKNNNHIQKVVNIGESLKNYLYFIFHWELFIKKILLERRSHSLKRDDLSEHYYSDQKIRVNHFTIQENNTFCSCRYRNENLGFVPLLQQEQQCFWNIE